MDKKKKDNLKKNITNPLKSMRGNRPPVTMCKITTQDSVPIYAVHEAENIIETYPGLYTKMYEIGENNYQTETEETQEKLFIGYRSIINSLGTNCEMSITICNQDINEDALKEQVLFKEIGDEYDYLRRQWNEILLKRVKEGHNGLEKKKYLTVGVHATSLKKAADVFEQRLDNSINTQFQKIGSSAKVLPLSQRLENLYNIYNADDQNDVLDIDLENIRSLGLDVRDVVGPSSMTITDKYLMFGKKYACVMKLVDYPSSLVDEFFLKITDMPFRMVSTINIQPIPSSEASRLVSQNILLARNEKIDQIKANIQANIPAPEEMISMDTAEKVEAAEDMRNSMIQDDEKLFKTIHTICFWADSKAQIDEYKESILSVAQANMVGLSVLSGLQEEGFNATLPLLYNEFPQNVKRTLKSSSVACASLPFAAIKINDPGGFNYSVNAKTKDLIIYNRKLAANANSFILGSSGSGKSFTSKIEMMNVLLQTKDDCFVIDPEAEYAPLAELIGGEVIKITPGGQWHINPMDISDSYEFDDKDDSNPVLAKAEFILRLIEKMMNTPYGLSPVQRTIVDECVHSLYAPFIKGDKLQKIPKEKMPTLTDLQLAFTQRKEPEARELAYALRLYTGNGSLNVFGFPSNVDTKSRFVVYDIKDVGDSLKAIAMLIIMDNFQNRLNYNQNRGKNTWFYVDECHLLFADEATSRMLTALWKRARKYGGVPTGITQNLADMLKSTDCCTLLQNCSFIQILNQAAPDREGLRDWLNLSDSQLDFITDSPKGQGLIYTQKGCVGFASTFPKDNDIFRVLDSSMDNLARYRREMKQNREITA